MLGAIYWNPSRIIFIIPYVHWPVTWYGALFATGFFLGFHIFLYQFARYLCRFPIAYSGELPDRPLRLTRYEGRLLRFSRSVLGIGETQKLQRSLLMEVADPEHRTPLRLRAKDCAESLLIHVMLATVVGARLGHILFYQNILEYLRHPLDILKTWEGGLASHGGILAILMALYVFSRKMPKAIRLNMVQLLDLLCVPMMLGFSFIRVGNFFNQEIVGHITDVPWAIIFESPMCGAQVLPRHPVQLYESLFYFSCFWILLVVWRYKGHVLPTGRMSGGAMSMGFLFRFCIEGLKPEQSLLLFDTPSLLLMGQYLSIPFIWLGICLFFSHEIKKLWKRPDPQGACDNRDSQTAGEESA